MRNVDNESADLIRVALIVAVSGVSWEEWWTYDGISGEHNIFILM